MVIYPASGLLDTCEGIYSDDKSTRRYARFCILQHTNNLQNCTPLATDPPRWKSIAQDIQATLEGHFPYAIDGKKPGVIWRDYELPPQEINTVTFYDQSPAYITLTAHYLPKDGNIDPLIHQLHLLRHDCFKGTPEEIEFQSLASTRNVVGVNFFRTLDSTKAQRVGLVTLQNLYDINTYFLGFAWDPVLKNGADFNRARRLAKLFKEALPETFEKLNKEFMKNKVIPMQDIRTHILKNPIVPELLAILTKNNKDRVAFLTTLDSDALALNGVFSAYDAAAHREPELRIASTGYRMTSDKSNYVKKACKIDQIARRGLDRYAYPPEPNFVVRIIPANQEGLDKITYVRSGSKFGGALESIGVTESLRFNETNSYGQICFDGRNPIDTTLPPPPRGKIPKHMPQKLNSKDYLNPKILSSFRKFLQTAYNPTTGFAYSVLHLMPGMGGQKSNGLVSRLFTSLDFIDCAKAFPTIWHIIYPDIRKNLLSKIQSRTKREPRTRRFTFKTIAAKICRINDIDKTHQQAVTDYLQKKFDTYMKAYAELSAKGLTRYQLASILAKANSVSARVYNYIMKQHEKALREEAPPELDDVSVDEVSSDEIPLPVLSEPEPESESESEVPPIDYYEAFVNMNRGLMSKEEFLAILYPPEPSVAEPETDIHEERDPLAGKCYDYMDDDDSDQVPLHNDLVSENPSYIDDEAEVDNNGEEGSHISGLSFLDHSSLCEEDDENESVSSDASTETDISDATVYSSDDDSR